MEFTTQRGKYHALVICFFAALYLIVLSPAMVTASSRYGGTLRVGLMKDIRPLDPHTQKGYLCIYAFNQMYDYLVRQNMDGSLEPRLATSWEQRDDGKTWIFHLRQGVKFHDGTDFNAEALKWNFERILDPKTKSYLRHQYSKIESMEVLDPYTLKINLKKTSYFVADVTGGIFTLRLVSPACVEKYGEDFVKHPAGTGPFMFSSLSKDGNLTLVRNPHFWEKDLPYLDKVVLVSFRDVNARNNALRAGEIDMESGTSMELIRVTEANPDLYYVTGPTCYSINFGVNMTKKPWDDVRIRRAILGYAVDRKRMAEVATFGLADPKVTVGALPHSYTERLLDLYPYDLEKAKDLLQEANMIGKEITFVINNTDNVYKNIASILKGSLESIGVKMRINVLDYQTWIKTYYLAHTVAFSHPLTYECDPAYWYQYLGPKARMNMSRAGAVVTKDGKEEIIDPVTNILLEDCYSTADPEKRKGAYQKLFRHLAEDAIMIGVITKPFVVFMKKEVKNYTWRDLNQTYDTVYWEK
ncbi:MAG: ABC transporter substrate-binding protein [Deltaproteobacteria bacterium]|nr:ABC transporter substrate-binding protein [Deltaproteobacteria bacterium]MBW2065291.1 ABC transporter substrate-binding protein [Deltaproteobacteria bacterium]